MEKVGKIAIIEDAGIMRLRLEKVLLKGGLSQFEFIKTDKISMAKIEYVLNDIALIIIDLNLHELDAIEVILRIRKVKSQSEIAIMALSDSSEISILKKAIVAGCSDFVLKPFEDETLVVKAWDLLGITEKTRSRLEQMISLNKNPKQDTKVVNWKDFAIGIEEIDHDHSEIVQNFEKLYLLMKEGKGHEYYNELLPFLNDYVHRHFDHEEAVMIKMNFNRYEEHKKIHEEFKLRVARIVENYNGESVTNSDLLKINLFIKDWLIHHILMEDRKIGEFFEACIQKK